MSSQILLSTSSKTTLSMDQAIGLISRAMTNFLVIFIIILLNQPTIKLYEQFAGLLCLYGGAWAWQEGKYKYKDKDKYNYKYKYIYEQLDSSVYTVGQGRVKQARHMHPVQAGASTREREDCVVAAGSHDTGSRWNPDPVNPWFTGCIPPILGGHMDLAQAGASTRERGLRSSSSIL